MPLYGIIDAAHDPRIHLAIKAEEQWKSLFGGPIDPDLLPFTPHIVRLDDHGQFKGIFQRHGWDLNWGLVCWSSVSLMDVRRVLRRNLQAMLPDGRAVLFRFYDPRVWRPYIETCVGE